MAVGANISSNQSLSSVEPASAPNPDDPQHRLLHVSFNQDGSCFAAGTTAGFRVYRCDRFREMSRRDALDGPTGFVEMLFLTNILALIGDGGNPHHPPTKAVIWDEKKNRRACSLTYPYPVRGFRLRSDRLVAVLDSSVFVYSFPRLRLLRRYETAPNPRGLCAVTPLINSRVLAFPGPREGQVLVERHGEGRTLFDAHASVVACLALSQDGRLVATAGAGCAAVRVFDAADGKLLREANIFTAASEAHCLAFSSDSRFLAASSDEGTVQVFALGVDAGGEQDVGAAHVSSSLFRTGDGERCVVAFGTQINTVVVVSLGGSFYRCRFDPVAGGEMTQLDRCDFM